MSRVARRFLRRVWGRQPGEGYVFLSNKDWETGHWEDCPFDFPLDEDFRIPSNRDLYFAPCIFAEPSRRKAHALPGRWLYADLDEVDPRSLDIEPTIAWETSPGRYQCLWELVRALRPEQLEVVNQKLTYHTGADRGGWSSTKVLRVPGSVSTKREYEYTVQNLWTEGPVYEAAEIYQRVKKVKTPRDVLASVPDLVLPKATASKLRRRHWDKLGVEAKNLIRAKEATEGTRSEKLWKLERLLVEAGVPAEHVFVIVKASVWNKYKGQGREEEQLWKEVQQAVQTSGQSSKSKTVGSKSGRASTSNRSRQESNGSKSKKLVAYQDFVQRQIHKPMWMVEGVWSEGAHGVLAGEPKTFKSVIATDLAMSVASGTRFLNHFDVPQTGPVIMIQKENDEGMVQDRVQRIASSKTLWAHAKINGSTLEYKAHADLPIHLMNNDDFDLTDEDDMRWLRKKIRKINPVLVVLDPLYLLAPGVDENSAAQMTPILARLLSMKQRYGCGTLLIHHFSKPNAENPRKGAQRISGTGAFHRWYESALMLERPDIEEARVKISPEHRGHSPGGGFYATFDFGSDHDLHYSVEIEANRKQAAKSLDHSIRDIIEGGEGYIPLSEMSEALGVGVEQVKRRLQAMNKAVHRKRMNGRTRVVVKAGGDLLEID